MNIRRVSICLIAFTFSLFLAFNTLNVKAATTGGKSFSEIGIPMYNLRSNELMTPDVSKVDYPNLYYSTFIVYRNYGDMSNAQKYFLYSTSPTQYVGKVNGGWSIKGLTKVVSYYGSYSDKGVVKAYPSPRDEYNQTYLPLYFSLNGDKYESYHYIGGTAQIVDEASPTTVFKSDVEHIPTMEEVDNWNFDIGRMYIAYPRQSDKDIQGSGFWIRFKAKVPFKVTGSWGTPSTALDKDDIISEIEKSISVGINDSPHKNITVRSVSFDDDEATASKRGWYKVSGEVQVKQAGLTDGSFKLSLGSNVITGVNQPSLFSWTYTREWYSDTVTVPYKGFVDNDGDGIDDNTGTHIGQDSDGGNPDGFPEEPKNGSILDYLKYYGNILLWIINIPVNLLKELVGFLTSTFNNVSSSFSEMGTFFSSFFSFLPGPLAGSLWLVLIAMFITGIIKIVR